MSEDMYNLLQKDNVGLDKAKNVPAKLFRSVLYEMDINNARWDKLMLNYLNSPRSGSLGDPAKKSYGRSNLNRALSKDQITWKVFRVGLLILNPKKISYELELTWDKRLVYPKEPPEKIILEARGSENELSRLFRGLLYDLGVTPDVWGKLLDRYLDKEVGDNPAERSTQRSNLRKSLLARESITWGMFVTGLTILDIKEVNFKVLLDWRKGQTCHSYTFKPS